MSLFKQLLLEVVSEEKKAIIQKNVRKRLYKIFKHEGHIARIISLPKDKPISQEARDNYIKNNIFLFVEPITEELLNIDPTKNGQYLNWIYSVFIKNDHYLPTHPDKLRHPSESLDKIKEDAERVKSYIKLFHENKHIIKRQDKSNNIDDYDSPQELLKVINQFRSTTEDGELIITKDYVNSNFDNDEAEVFFETDKWIVVTPKTEKASCILGVDSEWCTSYGKDSPREEKRNRSSMFSSYAKDPLFIVQNKNDVSELYQFSFESSEFMDKDDGSVNIAEFFDDNPELEEEFEDKGYFIDDMKRIENLIENGEFEEAKNAINGKGYGYTYVEKIDYDSILTAHSIDENDSDVITEVFDVKIESFSANLSNFLLETKKEFLAGESQVIDGYLEINDIIQFFSREEKENIIKNAVKKHKDIGRDINIDLPVNRIFDDVFEFINKDGQMVKDVVQLDISHVNDDLYDNLKEYIERIVNYMGFIKYNDEEFLFSIYYEMYEPDMLSYYLSDSSVSEQIYNEIGRLDQIVEEVDVELEEEIKANIQYAVDNKLEFEDFENFVAFITVDDLDLVEVNELRDMLTMRGYLDSNVRPVNDPDQTEMKFEHSLLRIIKEIYDNE